MDGASLAKLLFGQEIQTCKLIIETESSYAIANKFSKAAIGILLQLAPNFVGWVFIYYFIYLIIKFIGHPLTSR